MNQQSLLRNDLLTAINLKTIERLNANNLSVVFRGGNFRETTDKKFEFFTYPQPNIKKSIKFVPFSSLYQTRQKNLGVDIDSNDVTLRMQFGLTGENDRDPNLILERQAIEEYRQELLSGLFDVTLFDTSYQIYTDNDNTGEVPLIWEADEEYTVLYNIESFTDDLGYTVVDGLQINALSVTIQPADPSTGAIKFTTGSSPTEAHKQFITQGGILGEVIIRTQILKGDFTSLDDDTIRQIVDGKDRSGLFTELVDNDKDFENWTTSDFEIGYTSITYNGSVTPELLNPDVGTSNINGNIMIIATMTVSFDLSVGLLSGTNSTFKIKKKDDTDFTELTTSTIVIGNVKAVDSDQLLDSDINNGAKTRGQKRFRNITLTVKHQDITILKDLVKEFIDKTVEVNQQYNIEFTMFSGDTKYEKLVMLETGSATITRGENESMQLQFKEFLE